MAFVGVVAMSAVDESQGAPQLPAQKVAFDLSHGQFQDVFVDPSYYDYVLPEYRKICTELGEMRLRSHLKGVA